MHSPSHPSCLSRRLLPVIALASVALTVSSAGAATPTTPPAPEGGAEVTVSLRPLGAPEATPAPRPVRPQPKPSPTIPPVAEFRFNDAAGLQLRNGAALGPDGSGVSGRPGDKSLSAGTVASPAAFCVVGGPTNAVTADDLTVTAWYKPRTDTLNDAVNLFNGFASSLLWDAKGKQWTWRVASGDPSNPKVQTWYPTGQNPGLLSPGKWTFLAMVWKRSENTAWFYLGTPDSAPVEFRKMARKESISPAVEPRPSRTVGNDERKTDRCFNGEIDDVRFYTNALGQDSLLKIYRADLQNAPVAVP